jgi:streptogramin lyase
VKTRRFARLILSMAARSPSVLRGGCEPTASACSKMRSLGVVSAFAACVSVVVTLVWAQGALGTPTGRIAAIPTAEGIISSGITAGPDGNLWFTDAGTTGHDVEETGNRIGRITPSGRISQFLLPTGSGSPEAITAGPDGNLWFTVTDVVFGNSMFGIPNSVSASGTIGRITPSGTISEFPIPTANNRPEAITAGPDGNLWFTEGGTGKIGRITSSGTITEFPLPPAESGPSGITAGPDGNLWFTESDANKIGRITPSGTITEFPTPTAKSIPVGITAGRDGNLWFTEWSTGKIGRITPSGTISEFPIPTAHSIPVGITAGPDGNLWFTVTDIVFGSNGISIGANTIGRITPSGGITEFPISSCVVPKLSGKTLTQARRLIARAHCKLGRVSRPKRHSQHKLVVVSQKPSARKTLPTGTKVSLRLG